MKQSNGTAIATQNEKNVKKDNKKENSTTFLHFLRYKSLNL